MIPYYQIQDVHIELTTLCNARCPLCVRNANGYPHNFGYPEVSLTLGQVKKIFPEKFIQQLRSFTVCGNYGDFLACRESLEILTFIKSVNPTLRITISTNGSARTPDFWQELAKLGPEVFFCIDGLSQSHLLYRLDTDWDQIIKNAGIFIAAGGRAVWKMIEFDHNSQDIEPCKELAKKLGFIRFDLTNHGRMDGTVFDRQGRISHYLGNQNHQEHVEQIIQWAVRDRSQDWLLQRAEKNSVSCYSENANSIYVAANGEVYPCCYLGFYPNTFARSHWHVESGRQLSDILAIQPNNALEHGLERAMAWFDTIRDRWSVKNYSQGRLRGCDEHCGENRYIDDVSRQNFV